MTISEQMALAAMFYFEQVFVYSKVQSFKLKKH